MRWLLLAFLMTSCLPSDSRPTPGEALLTLRGSELVTKGIATADGWQVSFDRLLISLGGAQFGGDNCTAYDNDNYRRLFDAAVLEPQKVALKYALGTCEVQFRVSTPEADSIESTGVSDQDKELLRTGGTNAYEMQATGVSIYVKGSAHKAGAADKTFTWQFRGRRYSYSGCADENGAPKVYEMTGGSTQTIELGVHPEVLFATTLDPKTAKLQFAPFAAADKDGNDDITLEELAGVTLEDAMVDPTGLLVAVGDAGIDSDAGTSAIKNFEDFVYLGLFPHIVGLGPTGYCKAEPGRQRPD